MLCKNFVLFLSKYDLSSAISNYTYLAKELHSVATEIGEKKNYFDFTSQNVFQNNNIYILRKY